MTSASLRQRGIDTRLDVAFGLAANCSELRNHQIAGPLKHSLLAKRERLDLAKKTKMLQHFGNFENIAGPHLVRKILEPILPIAGRRGKIICQRFEERLAFA